jgi:hypothetical protein
MQEADQAEPEGGPGGWEMCDVRCGGGTSGLRLWSFSCGVAVHPASI